MPVFLALLGGLLWLLSRPFLPLTGEMLNEQGNATTRGEKPALSPKFLSIGKTAAEVTPEATTAGKKIKKTTHGLSTGDFVILTELNGKTAFGSEEGGLTVGFGYWVRAVSANEFALAYTKAQAENATEGEWVPFTVEVKITSKFAKVVELSVITSAVAGNRPEAKWKTGANGQNELESAVIIESNANSQEVKWLLGYSAISGGTLCLCEKAEEPFRTLQKGDKYEVPTAGTKISQLALLV